MTAFRRGKGTDPSTGIPLSRGPQTPARPHTTAHSGRTRRALISTVACGLLGVGILAPTAGAASQAQRPVTLRSDTVDNGWQVAPPSEEGLDGTLLDAARAYAFDPAFHTQGVVVIRGGRLVAEWYAPGEGPRSWSASWSVGKSFTSALIGIAIAQGKIPSVDVPMTTYFPEWIGTPKATMTLRQVLHMESGLKWDEDYTPSTAATSDIIQMLLQPDELDYAKNRPYEVAPGTRWAYSSGDAMLLSQVIQQATGMPADAYARQVLFDPIGAKQVEWWRDADNHTLTYCCLDTTTRNFARFGLLYLNGGNWNGQQVVPASWVTDSLTPTALSNGQYGYQWWITSAPGMGTVYMANGFDGQFIYIIPSLDMVIARNGDYVKSECDPIASPNLFSHYPPSNIVPGQGTRPPEGWSHQAFLAAVDAAVTGGPTANTFPTAEAGVPGRDLDGQAMAPCVTTPAPPATPPATVAPTTPPAVAPVAQPLPAAPTYTG